jgi:hypothetical protein
MPQPASTNADPRRAALDALMAMDNPGIFGLHDAGLMENAGINRDSGRHCFILWVGKNRPAYIERIDADGEPEQRYSVKIRSRDLQRDEPHEVRGSVSQAVQFAWAQRGDADEPEADPDAHAAGLAAFQSISGKISDGKFYREPRCPYRRPERIAAWMRGYDAARDAFESEG